MADIPATPLLDTVSTPADLRRLHPDQLRQLADELRQEVISAVGTTGGHLGSGLGVVELTTAIHYVFDTPDDRLIWDVGHQCYPHKILTGRRDRIRTLRQGGGLSGFTKRTESPYDPFGAAHSSTSISAVSVTGGHLGAGLGVVELTVALHAVFDTPRDRLIWDVGHQAYPHKILTGRRDRIRTLRQKDGLSGFTKRSESPYDPFGAAHSSTSISAALGFAVARDLGGEPADGQGIGDCVAVIGDGSISAGMAYEALNNAGHLGTRMFVILNDNEMSIAPPVGAMSAYLSRLYAGEPFQDLRAAAKAAAHLLPPPLREGAKRAKDALKHLAVGHGRHPHPPHHRHVVVQRAAAPRQQVQQRAVAEPADGEQRQGQPVEQGHGRLLLAALW